VDGASVTVGISEGVVEGHAVGKLVGVVLKAEGATVGVTEVRVGVLEAFVFEENMLEASLVLSRSYLVGTMALRTSSQAAQAWH
jgi:hypothetical protein